LRVSWPRVWRGDEANRIGEAETCAKRLRRRESGGG
jgi:hypothetical protein